MTRWWASTPAARFVVLWAGVLIVTTAPVAAEMPGGPNGGAQTGGDANRPEPVCQPSMLDSPYIPVDSWIYPAVLRLYSLGFVDDVFLGMRPWTRASVSHMLEQAGARIDDADPGPATDEAQGINEALNEELNHDMQGPCGPHRGTTRLESVYTVARAISGTPLEDSYHLGQTIVNDYGRPYENGFNNYTGASGYAGVGRFLIYARGEFEGAPSAAGYSTPWPRNSPHWTARRSISTPPLRFRWTSWRRFPPGPIGASDQWASNGSVHFRPFSEPRDLVRKAGRLAGAWNRCRHGLLQ